MKYVYKARFVPSSTRIEDARDIKTVTFVSQNVSPSNSDIRNAKVKLQKKINSYVARNYWSLSDFIIGYEHPPWKSLTRIKCDLRGMIGPSCKIREETKDEHFLSIDHHSGCSPEEIAHFIEGEYDFKIDFDNQIESIAGTNTRFYYRWRHTV